MNLIALETPMPRIYSDISFEWKMKVDDSVYDLHSLRQKILFVLATYKGTRKWRENFGSYVEKYLFEPFDTTTAGWIQSSILQALEEPANGLVDDVTVDNVKVVPDSATMTYWVKIVWSAPKLSMPNTAAKDSFSFNLRKL